MTNIFDDIPEIPFDAGRKKNVLLEWLGKERTEVSQSWPFGEVKVATTKSEIEACRVWADPDLRADFEKIPGVLRVKVDDTYAVKYYIEIDPRYDHLHVGREIVAVAELAEGKVKPKKSKKSEVVRSIPAGYFAFEMTSGKFSDD